jgi:hypothetical protein
VNRSSPTTEGARSGVRAKTADTNTITKLQVADRAQAMIRAREAGLGREAA